MPTILTLLPKLQKAYPDLSFTPSDDFSWAPHENTVYYDPIAAESGAPLLLHELSHALLHHAEYSRDVQLVTMERQAWDHALTLAPDYDLQISDDDIQANLDTYRDWLHARSTCPHCQAIGHQMAAHTYHCIACGSEWRVNEARICALRRYQLK